MSTHPEKKEKLAQVIPIQKPLPIPSEFPFGTPSPEDAIIEVIDNGKKSDK